MCELCVSWDVYLNEAEPNFHTSLVCFYRGGITTHFLPTEEIKDDAKIRLLQR